MTEHQQIAVAFSRWWDIASRMTAPEFNAATNPPGAFRAGWLACLKSMAEDSTPRPDCGRALVASCVEEEMGQ